MDEPQQLILGADVVVERRPAHVEGLGDIFKGGGRVALRPKDLRGRRDDLLLTGEILRRRSLQWLRPPPLAGSSGVPLGSRRDVDLGGTGRDMDTVRSGQSRQGPGSEQSPVVLADAGERAVMEEFVHLLFVVRE